MNPISKIGVFDSGYGGLTILDKFRELLPEYDYVYLGDNARTPYGTRSFEVVYKYTWQSVQYLFAQGCDLVILACNTASAKALRSIQQINLPQSYPNKRVLGVIRPTVEVISDYTQTGSVGIFGTEGTILSDSYPLEIKKLFPQIKVSSVACPMFVPIIENSEAQGDGADYFVKKYIDQLLEKDSHIDTLILACTHYPLLKDKIQQYLPDSVQIISQGDIIAQSLKHYLQKHVEMAERLSKNGTCRFLTTESCEKFSLSASNFLSKEIKAEHISLD